MILPVIAHDVKVISIGMFVKAGQPVVWRGPMLHRALQQFLADVFWGDLDVLLLDLPPGTGGRSSSSTSRSPQNTSARNCCRARCSIGPRHTTGWPALTNMPIEMTFTSCAITGRIMSSTRVGDCVT